VPHADPPTASLLWWAYVPATLAALATGSPAMLVLAIGLAAGERLGAWVVGRARACVLQPAGIDVRGPRGPRVRAVGPCARHAGDGRPRRERARPRRRIRADRRAELLGRAAVIELRAQLGPNYAADVHFRVRFENGGIAVVGEVESLH
jgi:hypothetical protein